MKKLAMTAGLALAMGISASAMAHSENSGYVTDSNGTVWRTGFGGCWHNGFWDESKATVPGCDGYEEQAVAAAPAQPAPQAPAPAPAMAMDKKFAVFFDFDSSVVDSVSDIVNYVKGLQQLNSIRLVGHADPLGSDAYNMALSKRRAENVAAALRASGVDGNKMVVDYMGEKNPVAQCSGRGAALISCLRADRRVDVQINGKK